MAPYLRRLALSVVEEVEEEDEEYGDERQGAHNHLRPRCGDCTEEKGHKTLIFMRRKKKLTLPFNPFVI